MSPLCQGRRAGWPARRPQGDHLLFSRLTSVTTLADALADWLAPPRAIDWIAAHLPRIAAEPLNVLTKRACRAAPAYVTSVVGRIGTGRALIRLRITPVTFRTTNIATDACIWTAGRSVNTALSNRAARVAAHVLIEATAHAQLGDAAGVQLVAARVAADVLRLAKRATSARKPPAHDTDSQDQHHLRRPM